MAAECTGAQRHPDPDHPDMENKDMDGPHGRSNSPSDNESIDSSMMDENGFEIPRYHLKRRRRSASGSSIETVMSASSRQGNVPRTVLFRPSTKGDSVTSLRLVKLEDFLNSEAPNELREIRINRALNIVAVDVKTIAGVTLLLALNRLCTMPVRAAMPTPKCASTGVIRVVDLSLTDSDLCQRLRSPLDFHSVKRRGKDSEPVKIVFVSSSRPSVVHIGTVKCPVSAYKPKPTQCFKCGRFGHVNVSCPRPEQCLICAGDHATSACPEGSVPKCSNCGLAHSSVDKTCPVKKRETAAHRCGLKESIPTRKARKMLKNKGRIPHRLSDSSSLPNRVPPKKHRR
ncbi:uncharacterized protein LOC135368072 [Ornithodoros turicata]|uniref:uncharacterized protein LOC135367980 n=1 Tax=Ornithodoros turicata TaxID=34597 RepID=UPI003139125C